MKLLFFPLLVLLSWLMAQVSSAPTTAVTTDFPDGGSANVQVRDDPDYTNFLPSSLCVSI